MIETEWVLTLLNASLLVMVALLPFAAYRALRGKGTADRLLGVDMITLLITGVMVLLAPLQNTDGPIDLAIVLSALAFVGTLSIARYIAEGRVF